MSDYLPNEDRYSQMHYRRSGQSGLKLPRVSLGLWHNFGDTAIQDSARNLIRHAFNCGITHFDLANNYGPPPGSAEENFGKILKQDFRSLRDELIISTKAGYPMWNGPYGDGGSKKYLVSSLDQSLQRMGLDYVDIFYHHRPDPNTPLEETMAALDLIVRQGKALYVGLSNYPAELTKRAAQILKSLGTPCIIHQPKYSMFERWVESGLLDVLSEEQIGGIAFSPLAGGLLTDRYLNGIPEDSRAVKDGRYLKPTDITEARIKVIAELNHIAYLRGQKLSQMALQWVLRQPAITSVLIGASKTSQIDDAVAALHCVELSAKELSRIDEILAEPH
ncbi:L-glyceraldehyde 3-phosphate reductase [Tolumonas lignilytica]|jgi:Predicted oxidoreductases (related to aryl-alcohol dehydrogenases)|uniref:L-glyceraldehyde 3-phosphate reductase n=1 Tax=Tolumonas lignilytica TaxID=1283284 RepID=UPI000467341B|nr:L-glyceraldehyde 3-phosphate reductase [Tolumonas lignilytica]